jgi:hypothetical protein
MGVQWPQGSTASASAGPAPSSAPAVAPAVAPAALFAAVPAAPPLPPSVGPGSSAAALAVSWQLVESTVCQLADHAFPQHLQTQVAGPPASALLVRPLPGLDRSLPLLTISQYNSNQPAGFGAPGALPASGPVCPGFKHNMGLSTPC